MRSIHNGSGNNKKEENGSKQKSKLNQKIAEEARKWHCIVPMTEKARNDIYYKI